MCVMYSIAALASTQDLTYNSYIIPMRAVWDVLPESEGEGNKFYAAHHGNASALL